MSPIVKYGITDMSLDISKVDPDPKTRQWSSDTIYHNINIILNKWYHQNDNKISIGVFRSSKHFGPKVESQDDIDIWIHPFKWQNKWHLVIGINPFSKIILINCSKDSKAGFPPETCIEFEQFITYFKSKVTKEALQYPKLCSDLLDPTSSDNGLNLLTIILTFCLRPDTLIKLFCDPSTTPRQFDVSDLIPHVINADFNFRKTLKDSSLSDLESDPEADRDEERNNNYQKIKKETASTKKKVQKVKPELSSSLSSSTLSSAAVVKTSISTTTASLSPLYMDNYKRLRSIKGSIDKPIDLDELEDDDEEEKTTKRRKVESKHIPLIRPAGRPRKVISGASEISKTKANTKAKVEAKAIIKTSKNTKAEKVTPNKEPSISTKTKSDLTRRSAENDESEVDSLEEEEDEEEEEGGPEPLNTLNSLFKTRLPKSFSKLLRMQSFIDCKTQIDIILEGIENWTHNKLTNATLKESDPDFKHWGLLIRENLIVEFTRRTKREFDEDELSELLQIDHHNEIFPLFFENNTIFLINFHTRDGFKTNVNIIVISTRPRGEREIMKNYAFKRLVEMYVWKYNRLITKIRTSIITVTNGSPYEIFMVSLHCVHKFIMNNKFDIKFAPLMDQVESYMDNFEKLMQSIKIGNEEGRDLSYDMMMEQLK